jgi:Flp pilus assembly protein TadD
MTAKGMALLGLGRNEKALAAFDLAISINPINTFVWQHRAEALRRLGRSAEADESHQHVFDT